MSMDHAEQKSRVRVALLSICAGLVVLGLKYVAYVVSGSVALRSDAIESIVNVVAALFALGAVMFAGKPGGFHRFHRWLWGVLGKLPQ